MTYNLHADRLARALLGEYLRSYPIFEALALEWESRYGWFNDMTHPITDREAVQLGLSDRQLEVLRYLWTSPSRPTCGYRQPEGTLVCLRPPDHHPQTVHFAQNERGVGYVWRGRV